MSFPRSKSQVNFKSFPSDLKDESSALNTIENLDMKELNDRLDLLNEILEDLNTSIKDASNELGRAALTKNQTEIDTARAELDNVLELFRLTRALIAKINRKKASLSSVNDDSIMPLISALKEIQGVNETSFSDRTAIMAIKKAIENGEYKFNDLKEKLGLGDTINNKRVSRTAKQAYDKITEHLKTSTPQKSDRQLLDEIADLFKQKGVDKTVSQGKWYHFFSRRRYDETAKTHTTIYNLAIKKKK